MDFDTSNDWQPLTFPVTDSVLGPDSQVQTCSRQWIGDFHCYLDAAGQNVLVVFTADGTLDPGTLMQDQADARGLALCIYDISIVPCLSSGQALTTDQLNQITLATRSPQTMNSQAGVATTCTVQQAVTFGVNGQVGAALNFQGGGVSWSDTKSSGYQYTSSFDISDWGILDQSDPVSRTASWVLHQQVMYASDGSPVSCDIWALGPQNYLGSGNASWWMPPFNVTNSSSTNTVKGFPDLSIATSSPQIGVTWIIERSLIDSLGEAIAFNLTDTAYMFGFSAPSWPNSGGHRMAYYTQNGSWLKSLDLTALLAQNAGSGS